MAGDHGITVKGGRSSPADMTMRQRGGTIASSGLDHKQATQFMDPGDNGIGVEPTSAKERWDPERWRGEGLSPAEEK